MPLVTGECKASSHSPSEDITVVAVAQNQTASGRIQITSIS